MVLYQGQQPTSFLYVTDVILRMKIDLSASSRILICSENQQHLFLLITYRRKAAGIKCRCKDNILQ